MRYIVLMFVMSLSNSAFAVMPSNPQPTQPIRVADGAEKELNGKLVKVELGLGGEIVAPYALVSENGEVVSIVFDQLALPKVQGLLGKPVLMQGVWAVTRTAGATGGVARVFYAYLLESNSSLGF